MTRTLLIVDDIKSNREILKNMLGGEYRILEAEHGQEALAVMTADFQAISAVLLDLGMPVMDGYEVLSYMRESEKLSQLPVIVTTGQTDAGSEEKALKLGAKDYISKPYKSAIIKQRIWNTINLRETAAAVNTLQRDRLTGVWNRETFFEKAAGEIAQKPEGYFVLGCVDIDGFKVINDQYGNEIGDRVLKSLADALRSSCERNGGICGRIFADRFIGLYPRELMKSPAIGPRVLEASVLESTGMKVTLSVGRYLVEDKGLSVNAMYDRATIAQSTVKGRYDTHVAMYDEGMRGQVLREQQIVNEMNAALTGGQFEVWYQPQYNHATGALIGAEALVRWRHPEKGLIQPGVFVPVFEQNGFIYALDQYIWESVCSYLQREMKEGRSPLPVSVNVSRYDVLCPGFVDVIVGLIRKYGIPVELMRLEVTESAFAESTKQVVSVVKRLISHGFTLEIDDFGSGYSSLNTLKSVPAQVVKLDMRFLEGDDDSQRGGNIIESVVRMTKWLGMSVIAEGVERKEQADYLCSIGCNYVQGYLYARPMPEEKYRALCAGAGKEEKLLALETVENMDNNAFWDPESMDTLIFNSYVGAACIYEYHAGKLELLRASEKYAQIFGSPEITVESALQLDWAAYFDASGNNDISADLEKAIVTRQEITNEYMLRDLPGCPPETYLRSTIRIIASVGDRYLVYCISENITAQRKAERREREIAEQMKAVMDNVACGITAVSVDGEKVTYILANDRYYELLGYTRAQYVDEVNGKAFTTIFPEDKDFVTGVVSRVGATGKPATMEYRALRRDGRVVWLRSNVSMAAFDSVPGRVQLSTYTDITEQKKAELDLRNTTDQLRTMMDDIPGGFSRIQLYPDGKMRPVFINEGLCKLTGMTHDEAMAVYADDAMAGVHPDDVAIVQNAIHRMLKRGEAYSTRYRLIRGDGGYAWLSIFGRVSMDAAGDSYLNIYYLDATEQVRDEERQKELLDNLPYGVALFERDGSGDMSVVHLNKRYWELVNRSAVAYAETSFLNAVYPEDRGILDREIDAAIRENRDLACNLRILYGEGEYRPFHVFGRIVKKKTGGHAMYTAFTPISAETMSVQEMLPIALGAVMEAQTGYSFVKDKNLRYVCASQAVAELVHLASPADMLGKSDQELFGKVLGDAFSEDDRHILETGESLVDNIDRIPSEDGSDRYASTSKFPLKDSEGNVIGVYGVGRDVTETRAMQTQFELLTNSIPGGIATYAYQDGRIRLTYFSDGFTKLFNLSRAAYAALSAKDVYAGVFAEDLPELKRRVDALIRADAQVDCVYRVRLRDGGYKWINLMAESASRDEEKIVFNAVLLDVTERQEDMERMRISEEENRLAMQHTHNAVCRYDVATGSMRIPDGTQQKRSLPNILENVPYGPIEQGLISPETAGAYQTFFEEIRRGGKTGAAVFQRDFGQGWRWLEAHFSTIFSDTGKPVSAVVSYVDITDRLERDSAYTKWQQSLLDKDPASYSLFRCNVNKVTSFDTMEGSLLALRFEPGPFHFDERTAEYAERFVLEDDRERFIAFLHADALLSGYYQGKRIVTLEYRERLPEGDTRWLRLTVDLVEHAHSADVEGYLLFEDIDKAKRRELATIEQAKTDPLTGVMNRFTFAAQVNNILQTGKPGDQYALMMLDMDGFKRVNDAFGHGAGDQALIDVAQSLRTALRHDDLVGRLGGDEFLVFLSDMPGDIIAATKAKQLCALTRKAFSAEVEISGSIGIAIAPRDGTDFDTLYQKADAALYHVKGSGKDNYAFYQEDMAGEHLSLERKPIGAADMPAAKMKRRMLIVDDSRIDHALLTNIFAEEFIVEKAKDGGSALIRLRHYGSAISVVLLDLMMPGMDGFAVLEKMQESAELRSIPVIVVSGDEGRETSLRAIREGAVDFVNKPVDPEILRIRVQSAISKADNERLRAKNSFLEYQNSEVIRYKTALERSGIMVVEHDWVAGTFLYDPTMPEHIAGTYDARGLWHILLSDFVAETHTVQKMQELVQRVAADKNRSSEMMLVQMRTPEKIKHWFRMNVYKVVNAFGLAGKIYLTFIDLGEQRPEHP